MSNKISKVLMFEDSISYDILSYECSFSASVHDVATFKCIVYVMKFNKIRKLVTNGTFKEFREEWELRDWAIIR